MDISPFSIYMPVQNATIPSSSAPANDINVTEDCSCTGGPGDPICCKPDYSDHSRSSGPMDWLGALSSRRVKALQCAMNSETVRNWAARTAASLSYSGEGA